MALTIDFEWPYHDRLCWTDTILSHIACSTLSGTDVQRINIVPNPIANALAILGGWRFRIFVAPNMNIIADFMYYIQARPLEVRRVNKKTGGTPETVMSAVKGQQLLGLKTCSSQQQPRPAQQLTNTCLHVATGCDQMCYTIANPAATSSTPMEQQTVYQCGCGYGTKLNPNGDNKCILNENVSDSLISCDEIQYNTHIV
jgi:hypothetical protein